MYSVYSWCPPLYCVPVYTARAHLCTVYQCIQHRFQYKIVNIFTVKLKLGEITDIKLSSSILLQFKCCAIRKFCETPHSSPPPTPPPLPSFPLSFLPLPPSHSILQGNELLYFGCLFQGLAVMAAERRVGGCRQRLNYKN